MKIGDAICCELFFLPAISRYDHDIVIPYHSFPVLVRRDAIRVVVHPATTPGPAISIRVPEAGMIFRLFLNAVIPEIAGITVRANCELKHLLFWRMHRCARIIFSLNYHLGKWTPQQCIDFLVDRVGHERANAEGEVRRSFVGGYSPLYQVAYMIGGLQFYALKKELVDKGKMTYKQYHDAVLQENQLPVEMIRALLINKPPAKDFSSNWRFYPLDHQASNP